MTVETSWAPTCPEPTAAAIDGLLEGLPPEAMAYFDRLLAHCEGLKEVYNQ